MFPKITNMNRKQLGSRSRFFNVWLALNGSHFVVVTVQLHMVTAPKKTYALQLEA